MSRLSPVRAVVTTGRTDTGTQQADAESLLDRLQALHVEPDIDRLEQRLLQEALTKAEGNLAAAARLLGLSRAQFAYRLKKHEAAEQASN